jgi:vacuolar-type H+-ATPase subunit H
MENWGVPQASLAETKLQDFTHVGGPKPSNFVSFGELASTLDDAWRKGLETDAQTAAKAREDARRAFSQALQQANERGADVESTPAYADFLRAQDYAESLIGGGLGSMPKGERSLGEEALASVYQKQLDPLRKQIREQREAAGRTTSERNAQRVKAKESQASLPVQEPYKAPPQPARASAQVDTSGAESAWESQELDADAQSFAESYAMAYGREPTTQELAGRRREMLTNLRSGKQGEANVNRAMPGKWA